jgi:dihydrofolate reductase
MRKILVSQFLSLDGVMDAPEHWNKTYLSDTAVVAAILADFDTCDALLLGRTSYDFFAARWPSRSGEMADRFNTIKKYVVTATLEAANWDNTVILQGNINTAIQQLKERPGKNILVLGSHQLVQTLLREQLADAFKLYIYPLTLGTGKRLFEDEGIPQTFKLVAGQTFASGVVALDYHF